MEPSGGLQGWHTDRQVGGQQGWHTGWQFGMFWRSPCILNQGGWRGQRLTCAFSAGCSSSEDSGSTAAVAASAVAAAAVRKLGALWSLPADAVQKPRWRLTMAPQLSPLHAGWPAPELDLC